MGPFDRRVAIVTGAGRGLGRDYAVFLAADGAAVAVADLDPDGAAETAKMIDAAGGSSLAVSVDVSDVASTEAMAAQVVAHMGRIDILVNNAALWGDLQMAPIMDTEPSYWDRVMGVNLKGVWLCMRAVLPTMRAQGTGRIVNVSSIGAWMPGSVYGTTKAAVNQLTFAAAAELAPSGITVNAVAPGMIDNEATRRQVPAEHLEAMLAAMVPVGRFGTSRDIYGAIRYLCSDDAGWVTGQTISPNGGSHARW
ncbi:MAG: SDR family NAD(P)-dependent oxidoreductase [Acidimicrobiales bacterium]